MATTPMTTLFDTCRAMTAKVTTQKFTRLSQQANMTVEAPQTSSHQLLDMMAMGYQAPPHRTRTLPELPVHDTRNSSEASASLVAQQQAVFHPEINHRVQADWETLHRHQAITRRGMLA
ncbi:hypothetical protein [Cobetia crustatorum]|uniref:Uncharacterized protein n=1 Tax=Cobetia crustatorum TaxID=553385 RepID=A0A558HLM0_9GAMM|nr:hypothetical protein [Cobetia crustatorum]TVU70005.1 hypothetical protein FQP86_09300 [Cobetia crustatorum]